LYTVVLILVPVLVMQTVVVVNSLLCRKIAYYKRQKEKIVNVVTFVIKVHQFIGSHILI